MLQEDGTVRRIDLDLRKEVYGLKTEIYRTSDFDYQILCVNLNEIGCYDFTGFQKMFNDQVRYMGTPVSIVNTPPEKYQFKIAPIPFDNPVYNFKSTAITEPELNELINSNFPNVSIKSVICHPGMNFYIEIHVPIDTSDEQIREMKIKLRDLDVGTDDIRVERQSSENEKKHTKSFNPFGDILNIHLNRDFGFSVDETDYWLSHAQDIYEGKLKRTDISYYRTRQKNCYIDASVFDCTDIRKAILLYDTVYLGMPLEDRLDYFLESQNIRRNDLIELCDRGKIVLVLVNDSKRYDKKILDEVYRISPLNIVGQRGVNTLLASYFVDLDERFYRNYPGIEDFITGLYMSTS